jgi:peptidoglycan L-alanyl-D-glutamate endopeptidase CwlK
MNKRSLDRLAGIKPILIQILIEAAKDSPYLFEIPPFGGIRTAEEQNGLFLKHASKCDGYNKISEHQKGTAFDIFLLIDNKASWDKPALKKTMYHIKEVARFDFATELELGCDWGWDYPHAEIKKSKL